MDKVIHKELGKPNQDPEGGKGGVEVEKVGRKKVEKVGWKLWGATS